MSSQATRTFKGNFFFFIAQRFSVNWTRTTNMATVETEGRVLVDGMPSGGMIMRKVDPHHRLYSQKGFNTSISTFRPFLFGSLHLTGSFLSFIYFEWIQPPPVKRQTMTNIWRPHPRQNLET